MLSLIIIMIIIEEESEKRDKYQDIAREPKKLWSMKVTVIVIVIDTLGTVTKRFDTVTRGLGNKKTSGENPNSSFTKIGLNIEERPWRLEEAHGHSNSSEKPSANAGMKNSQRLVGWLGFMAHQPL